MTLEKYISEFVSEAKAMSEFVDVPARFQNAEKLTEKDKKEIKECMDGYMRTGDAFDLLMDLEAIK